MAVAIATPVDVLLGGSLLWHHAAAAWRWGPCSLPGATFTRSFRDVCNLDMAFGSNIAGAVVGGSAESLSMHLGFRYLLLIAVLFYLLSAWTPRSTTLESA